MNDLYLDQIKERTTDLMEFALQDLADRLEKICSEKPGVSMTNILAKVLPDRNQLKQTIDIYFQKNKYQSKQFLCDRTEGKKSYKKEKYVEIQLSDTQLCKFTTSEKTSKFPMYIHLNNNMVFVDKTDHYLCVGTFDPTNNQVDWFQEF